MKLLIIASSFFLIPQAYGTKYVNIGEDEVYKRSNFIVQGQLIKIDAIDSKGNIIEEGPVRTGPGAEVKVRHHIKISKILVNKNKEKIGPLIQTVGRGMAHRTLNPPFELPYWSDKEQIFLINKHGSKGQYRRAYPLHWRKPLKDYKGSKLEYYVKTYNGKKSGPYRQAVTDFIKTRTGPKEPFGNSAGVRCDILIESGKKFGPITIGMSRIELINLPFDYIRKVKDDPEWYIIGSFQVRVVKDKVKRVIANLGHIKQCLYVDGKKIPTNSNLAELSKYFKNCEKLKNFGLRDEIQCEKTLLEMKISATNFSSIMDKYPRRYANIHIF